MHEIRIALAESHPADFNIIRTYIKWLAIRRRVTDTFYARAHWARRNHNLVHWVGRS